MELAQQLKVRTLSSLSREVEKALSSTSSQAVNLKDKQLPTDRNTVMHSSELMFIDLELITLFIINIDRIYIYA